LSARVLQPDRGSTFNLSPHAANAALKPHWKQRQHGSYNNNGNTGTCNGNNIEGGGVTSE
jgi:hypothetical protein